MTFAPRKDWPPAPPETPRPATEADAALAAKQAQTRFLATVGHDLRQPVQALGLFVAALGDLDLPPEARRILGRIDNCVDSLDQLLRNRLDMARLDADAVEVHCQRFPLNDLFRRLALEFEAPAAKKRLSMRFVSTNALIYSDAIILERIIHHLLANAVRFTAAGGVVVGVRRRATELRIEIWDSGKGIDEAGQATLRDAAQPGPESGAGRGLGLVIVRRLARLLNCRIDIRSKPGRGTMFAIILAEGSVR